MVEKCLNKISFYIVAHADDWQLFMYPDCYNDIKESNHKIVFIITTAGDAGMNKNYWLAREEGSKSSARFCLDGSELDESEERKKINGHLIYSGSINNIIFYFLKLPDGNINGNGFSANNFQSLSKLKEQKINSVNTVDDSTVYKSWQDFFTTLEEIIFSESKNIFERSIHYINPDVTVNINDHADHIATGQAVQCINIIKHFKQVLYEGYSNNNIKNKLSEADIFFKTGMFAAYDKAVFDNSGYSTSGEDTTIYLNWCSCNAKPVIIEPDN